ncbi:MAG TPA: nitrite/sulfite reductase, partial [Azospirillaceae bacterium]|nr:nitrite/sulfite reductase [Azospirillaceae bacterium]
MPALPSPLSAEPLVRLEDLDLYRAGLEQHRAGAWDDERWTAFRVRFGIYGQRQPGVQMVRIKIPGGIVPVAWLRVLAHANRTFAQGDAHVTTRQDLQIYHVPLERTPDLLESLHRGGITTREACGNTVRNVNGCALAGFCPHERVDASRVAQGLALAWLRSPLTQNMPRKVKVAVSGCTADCGATSIHDLGLIAVEQDGKPGFRVLAGGGLGSNPRPAVVLAEFVEESCLPAVMEALLRLHQRYSDRLNRNAARLKFVAHRFGADTFRALFEEELQRLKPLPQRPWSPLSWRQPAEGAPPRLPVGVVAQHDGRRAVVITPTLGNVSSDQLDQLADIADRFAIAEARFTREQNIVLVGVASQSVVDVVAAVRALGQ